MRMAAPCAVFAAFVLAASPLRAAEPLVIDKGKTVEVIVTLDAEQLEQIEQQLKKLVAASDTDAAVIADHETRLKVVEDVMVLLREGELTVTIPATLRKQLERIENLHYKTDIGHYEVWGIPLDWWPLIILILLLIAALRPRKKQNQTVVRKRRWQFWKARPSTTAERTDPTIGGNTP